MKGVINEYFGYLNPLFKNYLTIGFLLFFISLSGYGQNPVEQDSLKQNKVARDSLKLEKAIQKQAKQDSIRQDTTRQQSNVRRDTTRVTVRLNQGDTIKFKIDTMQAHSDLAPLDIGSNRGIFIQSPDHLMQMRILGSVRAMFNYSSKQMQDQLSFNPFDVPTGTSVIVPNIYASLAQSRLGFEITRRTRRIGDVFVRLESDFNSPEGHFRIRHAYGQINHLIVGQTWSMFSNVSFLPATVSSIGPPGSMTFRTPQIRYTGTINNKLRWAAGIEYTKLNLSNTDTIGINLVQVIPDIAGRINYLTDKFSLQFSLLITTISGRDSLDNINYQFGVGGVVSAKYSINSNTELFASFTSGKAISSFVNMFRNRVEGVLFDPINNTLVAPALTGGYVAVSHNFPKYFSSSLSFGMANNANLQFQDPDDYNYSFSGMLDVFYQPADGARLGLEYAFGQRFDVDSSTGTASRVSLILYYDF